MTTLTTTLSPAAYLRHLSADGLRLAAAVRGADPENPIAACPGWTARDVAVHTGGVYHHKLAIFRLGRRPEEGEWTQGPPEGADAVDWFTAALEEMLSALSGMDPEAPTMTWLGERPTWFWHRRMAQETAVHRVDAESALGGGEPIDNDLALDGIDEVLDVFLAGKAQAGSAGSGEQVLVRTGEHAWHVALGPDRVVVEHGPGPSGAVVTADSSDLLLWLWGRRPDDVVHVEGDKAAVAALRGALVSTTQ
jgi:uncharacterized protein (TIGR03083 family)